jgi:hypothetical protein
MRQRWLGTEKVAAARDDQYNACLIFMELK